MFIGLEIAAIAPDTVICARRALVSFHRCRTGRALRLVLGALPHPDNTFNKSKPLLHPFSKAFRGRGSFRLTIKDTSTHWRARIIAASPEPVRAAAQVTEHCMSIRNTVMHIKYTEQACCTTSVLRSMQSNMNKERGHARQVSSDSRLEMRGAIAERCRSRAGAGAC